MAKQLLNINDIVQITSKPYVGCIGYITDVTKEFYIVEGEGLGIAVYHDKAILCDDEYMSSDKALPVANPYIIWIDILLHIETGHLERTMKRIEYLQNQRDICDAGGKFNIIEWNKKTWY